MALYERDFIMRVLKQLVEAIARALGLAREGKHDEAQSVLLDSCVSLLGMEYSALAMVDAATAADLLGDPARVFVFARLVAIMADVAHEKGDALSERGHATHAAQLLAEVLRRKPGHAEAGPMLATLKARLEQLTG